jgi:hypothetical protein
LGPYAASVAIFIAAQFSKSQGAYSDYSLFPYFLVPSGAPTLWGFFTLGITPAEPWLTIAICAALILTLVIVGMSVVGTRRANPGAMLVLICAALFALLVWKRNDFGLFKLAMFVQPFMWFLLAGYLACPRWLLVVPVALIGCLALTDHAYVKASYYDPIGAGGGVPGGSRAHLLSTVLARREDWCNVSFETSLLPLAKMLAANPGCARDFPSRPAIRSIVAPALEAAARNPLHRFLRIDTFTADAFQAVTPPDLSLNFKDAAGRTVLAHIPNIHLFDRIGIDPFSDTVFNATRPDRSFSIVEPGQGEGYLEFINSDLGSHYYLPDSDNTSLFAKEPDIFFVGRPFEAVGRYLLFRVISRSDAVRVLVDLTETPINSGDRKLPPAQIMGADGVLVGFSGHGAARVISPPVHLGS